MRVFGYNTSYYFNMENKIVDEIVERKINWNECIVDENGWLINRRTGEVYGEYLYEGEEEITYGSLTEAIVATLSFAV